MKTLKVDVLIVDTVKHVLTFGANIHQCVQQLSEAEALIDEASLSSLEREEPTQHFYDGCKSAEPLWRVLISNKKFISGHDAPDSYEQQYEALLRYYDAQDPEKNEYFLALNEQLPQSTFFTTQRGLIGLGYPDIQEGDLATIWFGAPVVFVLRPVTRPASETCFQLVATAYVGGIMNGEVVDGLYHKGLLDSKTVLIV